MFLIQPKLKLPSLFYTSIGLVYLLTGLNISCVSKEIEPLSRSKELPKVLAVYPTNDTLPENLLRLYVEFSHSMKAVHNLENIKLLNEKGQEIKGAIFNNVYELWDKEQKQLTLILDPSRVKTGLIVHESMGRALQANKNFQLVIEKAEDINGNLLEKIYVKNFFVTKADREHPKVENWEISLPEKNSLNPLMIKFPQMLDKISLTNRIWLTNSKREIVTGRIKISQQEKQWLFIPDDKWMNELYVLHVNGRLEDPAGNNLNGLFDHPIGSLKENEEGEIYEFELLIQ